MQSGETSAGILRKCWLPRHGIGVRIINGLILNYTTELNNAEWFTRIKDYVV